MQRFIMKQKEYFLNSSIISSNLIMDVSLGFNI